MGFPGFFGGIGGPTFQTCADCKVATNTGLVVRCGTCDAKVLEVHGELGESAAVVLLMRLRALRSASEAYEVMKKIGIYFSQGGK